MYLQSNFDINEVENAMPIYYRESLKYWRDVKCDIVEDKQDLTNQYVWYNCCIKIQNKTVYSDRLFPCGIWHVNDLYNNGELIPFNTWMARGASISDYMLWRGLVESIPCTWKFLVRNDVIVSKIVKPSFVMYENKQVSINDITERELKCHYRYVVYDKMHEKDFKAKMKYTNLFNVQSPDEWKTIYMLPFKLLVDNKVIEMQYKILHRIIGTNRFLYKIGKSDSPNCDNCMMYQESIEHLFF